MISGRLDYTFNRKFESDYYDSFKQGISLNPVLQSFQKTVKKYNIPNEHVNYFLLSMKKDLVKKEYSDKIEADEYIYGSAEVVGLMCLKVFCHGNKNLYNELEKPAMKLGSAFQKVNFLRDLKNDMEILERQYFHNVTRATFNEEIKTQIIMDIENDFSQALAGLKRLPGNSILPIYVAYSYYLALLKKIKQTSAQNIINKRIRISNATKFFLLIKTVVLIKLRIIK